MANENVDSRAELATLLICDLVDSTAIIHQLGDRRATEIFHRHDQVVRNLFREHGGREIDKTDGFLVLFPRPLRAVRFAFAYHEALADTSAATGLHLAAKVGIHFGEVFITENPPEAVEHGAKPIEVHGLAKSISARVMGLAHGGQILMTRGAYDLARRSSVDADPPLPPLDWRLHGEFELKGLGDPMEIFEVALAAHLPQPLPIGSDKAVRVGTAKNPRVLVLPFVEMSPEVVDHFIGDGLADEIITHLSGLEALSVISQTSSMQLKGTQKSIATLARELDVQFVLEGSVKRLGDSLRIHGRLIRCEPEEPVWAHKHDGKMEDIFQIQETISQRVAEALEIHLSKKEKKDLAQRPIPDIHAYEYYLGAKQQIYSFTQEGLDRALDYLQKGIEIIGDNIQLTAAMGYVYWQYLNAGISHDPEYLDKARACAEMILRIDPKSPDAHRLLGLIEPHGRGDVQVAVSHLKLSLAANPNDRDTLFWLSLLYGFAGRSSSGYPLISRLLEIDPLTTFHHIVPGFLAMLDGDLERARPLLLKARSLEPENPMISLSYGQLETMSGRFEDAQATFDQLHDELPGSFFDLLGQFYAHALRGDKGVALEGVTEELTGVADSDLQYSWSLAQCFAMIEEDEQAIDWLSNAVKQGFWNYPLLAERDPLLARLRGHERFEHLMSEVRRKWSSFEV